jgi:hypothetical protein
MQEYLWIDISLSRQYMEQSLQHHGVKCKTPYADMSERPLWLIDVEKQA